MSSQVPPILTNANGVPFDRPKLDDYPRTPKGRQQWLRAIQDFNDRVTECANRAFSEQLKESLTNDD